MSIARWDENRPILFYYVESGLHGTLYPVISWTEAKRKANLMVPKGGSNSPRNEKLIPREGTQLSGKERHST